MAAAVFYVAPGASPGADGTITLTGDEARHAAQVSRVRVGEVLHVVDGCGQRFEGEVTAIARDSVVVRVDRTCVEPEPSPRIVVIQALAKGDRGERAVEAMTEVGVDVIVPWSAEHCVTRWVGDRADRGVAKWRSAARTSAKQARRARMPEVLDLHSTAELEPLITGAALALCLDESADQPLASLEIPSVGDIVMIVGPEGGLSPTERDRLAGFGAQPALLGPTVLRTSTAGPVAAGVVLSRTSRWRAGGAQAMP